MGVCRWEHARRALHGNANPDPTPPPTPPLLVMQSENLQLKHFRKASQWCVMEVFDERQGVWGAPRGNGFFR